MFAGNCVHDVIDLVSVSSESIDEGNVSDASVHEDNCCVCYDRRAHIRFPDCRHVCCCIGCAMELVARSHPFFGPKCPICRVPMGEPGAWVDDLEIN